jgi:mannose-6-phosphate isomerase-like protein (cupin superfamily)
VASGWLDATIASLATAGIGRHPFAGVALGEKRSPRSSIARYVSSVHPFDVDVTHTKLREAGGGYEVVHTSPGLEIGVYVLVAPEADRQQPHDFDEVYIVLEGSGVLEVEGVETPLEEGGALFVPAGADHRFTAYEHLALLVIFNGPHSGP